jgi:nucleoside 2-deoxyribosyltransferase
MKAYLANSLFSQADAMYNAYIAEQLRIAFPDLELYVPQENEAINDKQAYANSLMIRRGDDKPLLLSDFLVAVIDGCEIDSGVACEIGKLAGYDMARHDLLGLPYRPIFALFTDVRQQGRDNRQKIEALIKNSVENQFPYRNLYVIGTIYNSNGDVVPNVAELIDAIRKYISSN